MENFNDIGVTDSPPLQKLMKCGAWFVLQIILATSIMMPFNQTVSAASSIAIAQPMDWPTFASKTQNWMSRDPIFYGTSPILVPKDNYNLVSQMVWTPSAATGGGTLSMQMIQGERWVTVANDSAGRLGLSSSQISAKLSKFQGNDEQVFAQYSPENATAHITIQRIEKTPDGRLEVRMMDFTPWHGEYWAAAGKYRTQFEIDSKLNGKIF